MALADAAHSVDQDDEGRRVVVPACADCVQHLAEEILLAPAAQKGLVVDIHDLFWLFHLSSAVCWVEPIIEGMAVDVNRAAAGSGGPFDHLHARPF